MLVTIMTDASWCPDTHAGGYGFWIACERGKLPGGGPFRVAVRSAGHAEMMAICNAIYDARKQGLVHVGDTLLVQTDCRQAMDVLEQRVHVGFKDIIDYFNSIRHGLTVHFRHVKGHTSNSDSRSVANKMCDKRAKEGMRIARAAVNANG